MAAEVKKLADRSREAADDIKRLSSETIQITHQATDSINNLVPIIKETTELVEEISISNTEQHRGIDQINMAIQKLTSNIQNLVQTSDNITSKAAHFDELSSKMAEMTGFFKD